MAETDFWGNRITASEPASAAAVRDFSDGLISFDRKAGAVVRAAKKDPGCAIANAYAAILLLWLERADSPSLARPFLEAAEAAAKGATERERRVIAYTKQWAARDIPGLIRSSRSCWKSIPEIW